MGQCTRVHGSQAGVVVAIVECTLLLPAYPELAFHSSGKWIV